MKRIVSIIIALSAVFSIVLTLSGCGKSIAIDYALSDEPVTLDPQIANDEGAFTVIDALFDGLTSVNENGEITPACAERWDISGDGKTYTFHINENARWSDGENVTANDFVFAFKRALDPSTASPTCQNLFIIENAEEIHLGTKNSDTLGAKALSDKILQITLEYPTEDILYLAATAVYMPCRQDFFEETNGQYGLDADKIIGNGGFSMENRYSWEHGEYINLIKDEDYTLSQVRPYRINFTINSENKSAFQLIESGNTAALLSYNAENEIEKNNLSHIQSYDTTLGICFNASKGATKSRDVRVSLVSSIDKEKLFEVANKYGERASGIIPPAMLFNSKSYRDQAGAVNLTDIKSAGNADIKSMTIICEDSEQSREIANLLITCWNKEYRHYFNIQPLSGSSLESRIKSGDYEIALLPVSSTGNSINAMMYNFTEHGENIGGYDSTELTKLTGTKKSTAFEVIADIKKAEQLLIDEGLFYPICSTPTTVIFPKKITGITLTPFGGGVGFYDVVK